MTNPFEAESGGVLWGGKSEWFARVGRPGHCQPKGCVLPVIRYTEVIDEEAGASILREVRGASVGEFSLTVALAFCENQLRHPSLNSNHAHAATALRIGKALVGANV